MLELDNTAISRHLGQKSPRIENYTPELLVREPRISNRTHLNLTDDNLPFVGYDVWNGWEVTGLLNNGLPFTAVAKVLYSATNKYIVESKSMKLYWNSFAMTKLGSSIAEAHAEIVRRAKKDLAELLETSVDVYIWSAHKTDADISQYFINYYTLEDGYSPECTVYQENTNLLSSTIIDNVYERRYHSTLLKSNCRITSQMDSGDIYIHYKGKHIISCSGLIQYIVSFRDENHFHEETCEAIYCALNNKFAPEELMVACQYVRRGSWEINPIRASHAHLIPKNLIDPTRWVKTARQ